MKKKYENKKLYNENTFLSERIKAVRTMTQLSAQEVAAHIGIPYERYRQIEMGRITPIPYYREFARYYGARLTSQIFTVDWSLYTGERLRTYIGHYEFAHPRAAIVEMHISPSSLSRMTNKENGEVILNNYKEAIDRMFGESIADDDMRYTYAVGINSEYITEESTNLRIIVLNEYYTSKNKPHDSRKDLDQINKEVNEINSKIRDWNRITAIHLANEDEIIEALKTQYDTFLAKSRKEE